MDRFRNKFALNNNMHPVKRCTLRIQQTINGVQRSVDDDSNVPIPQRVNNGACVHPLYAKFCVKILVGWLELKTHDHHSYRTFCE